MLFRSGDNPVGRRASQRSEVIELHRAAMIQPLPRQHRVPGAARTVQDKVELICVCVYVCVYVSVWWWWWWGERAEGKGERRKKNLCGSPKNTININTCGEQQFFFSSFRRPEKERMCENNDIHPKKISKIK